MEHFFELPIGYNGAELVLKARLVTFGYIYKFYIVFEGQELLFQRDDEQHFKMFSSVSPSAKNINNQLVEAIRQALETVMVAY